MTGSRWQRALVAFLAAAAAAPAAVLPPHRTLRVLIVSDEVNPHGLRDDELTQPGEISLALRRPGAGLVLDPAPDGVLEVPTNQIELATAALARPPCDPLAYHVLVYFAHRIPDNGGGAARQDAFTAAVAAFLAAGGGVVSFHHGSYYLPGKEGILDLIGATADGAVPWDTVDGQDVIAVLPGHFVTTNAVAYAPTLRAYADPARGVPAGDYPWLNNTPDERYPILERNPTAGDFSVLFASDYLYAGNDRHVLGFTHHRPGWRGKVVGYQPGEYEPNALDVAGPNFQILANAIVDSAAALGPDAPVLRLVRGPGPGEATLTWSGGRPDACVYRAAQPAAVRDAANVIAEGTLATWVDQPPAGSVYYYQVSGR